MNSQDQYPDVLTAEVIGKLATMALHGSVMAEEAHDALVNAAAEITRLRTEVEQANRQIAARNTYLEAERDALKAEVEGLRRAIAFVAGTRRDADLVRAIEARAAEYHAKMMKGESCEAGKSAKISRTE